MDANVKNNQLMENDDVRKVLDMMKEHYPDTGHDYSLLFEQMEQMARQLDHALKELAEVKVQLQNAQESPVKKYVSHAVDLTENQLRGMSERLTELKGRIVENAKETLEKVKQIGVKALDKAFSVIGVKKLLEILQDEVAKSVRDVGKTIEKVEAVGQELRSVGGHLKNVGRAAIGKETVAVDGGVEGRFQSRIVSSLRLEEKILCKMNDLALGAIESVDRLGRSAERASEEKQTEKSKEDVVKDRKEKPSVMKDLQEKKSQVIMAIPAVNTEKMKAQEAAL